ncbi:hypothetical protein BDZ97DRAFT_1355881 [Flammula alnicola]|nr:hypothetical protein BDZ97DRAFT_1355881 [Flammula alnicola]
MEKRRNPGSGTIGIDEDATGTPSMPMKVVITQVEEEVEDWSSDFELKERSLRAEVISSYEDGEGRETSNNFAFGTSKIQIWRDDAETSFGTAFYQGLEQAGVWPPQEDGAVRQASAFGPSKMPLCHDVAKPALEAASDHDLQAAASSMEQDVVLSSLMHVELSPVMPCKPAIQPQTEADLTFSPLFLCSPSLDFDSSASISQLLISPQFLEAAPLASSPAIYDISYNNPNSPFSSPLVAISTLMFSSHGNRPPVGRGLTGEDLDLPALMRLEIAASLPPHPEDGGPPSPQARPLVGLGFEILPAQLPDSLFPSYNSFPSFSSFPSIDLQIFRPTSTPPPQTSEVLEIKSIAAGGSDVGLGQVGDGKAGYVDTGLSSSATRQALSDITEESTRALALANEPSMQIVGLGLGALAECSLQSSSSISKLRSPERPPLTATLLGGFEESYSMRDGMHEWHQPSAIHHEKFTLKSSIWAFRKNITIFLARKGVVERIHLILRSSPWVFFQRYVRRYSIILILLALISGVASASSPSLWVLPSNYVFTLPVLTGSPKMGPVVPIHTLR